MRWSPAVLLLAGAMAGTASRSTALPAGEVPTTIAIEPGEGISPDQAHAPAFLLDKDNQLIVIDQARGFFLGRFAAPLGLAPESPVFPGGLSLEFAPPEGPPLPFVPMTALQPQYGFPFVADGGIAGSPCVADVDADGRAEIALATMTGDVHLLSSDGQDLVGWPQYLDDGFYAAPSMGDLDGDGDLEIVAVGISGKIYVWQAEGSPLTNWPLRPSCPVTDLGSWRSPDGTAATSRPEPACEFFGAAALADLDGDGRDEICVASAQGTIWVLRSDGSHLPGWPKMLPANQHPPNPAAVFASPAIADLDRDGDLEIVVATHAYQIHAWQANGEAIIGWPVWIPHRARGGFSDVAIGDVNGDGELEVVITSEHGFTGPATVALFNARGMLLPGWPYALPEPCNAGPALGDINADGIPEIVAATIGGNAAVVALDGSTGTPLPGWPVRLKQETVNASPVIADIDGDGSNDILIAALSTGLASDAWIWALNGRGEQLSGYPIMLPQDDVVSAGPVAADLDGDGDLELLAATERLNSLYCWDLEVLCEPETLPWPALSGGPARRGTRLQDHTPRPRPNGAGIPLYERPVAPEPARGPPSGTGDALFPRDSQSPRLDEDGEPNALSAISFELAGTTKVSLIIFDIKHSPVRRLLNQSLPPGRYEIHWDGLDELGKSLPTGIYFYQLSLGTRSRTHQLLLLK